MSSSSSHATVRLATRADLPEIVRVMTDAFIEDPAMNYFAAIQGEQPKLGSKEYTNLSLFFEFLLKADWNCGGRVTVVESSEEASAPPKIHAVAVWMPPGKRLETYKIIVLIRSGIFKPLGKWGLRGLTRTDEHVGHTETVLKKAFKARKAQDPSFRVHPNDTWRMEITATDPTYQGRGFLSLLAREAYGTISEGTPVTLEATTVNSRDRYAHLGFEVIETTILGKGKVSEDGLAAKGEKATGIPIFVMVNWNGRDRPETTMTEGEIQS